MLRIASDIGFQAGRCVVLAYEPQGMRVIAYAEIYPAEREDANGDPFMSVIAFDSENEVVP